ncbi:MAG: hypothetical protein KME15_10380 [Drouetiella hepatica Uher 2000/2452]|jgi:hypothetical protein|uniref:Uncharacterized protein n=1 Tax=Drouetiella hepatica Uher 2000/2452 TaxID=904376 RepID=A0A951QA78_9CYAN|nr:hypothetical protein [Drouetiella hepatica Uher 2000/2452]
MWRYISFALRHFLSTGLSVAAVFASGLACILTRHALYGRNYSDVGVPMYENAFIATMLGILVFFVLLFGSLYILQRTLSRNLQWLPYLVAVATFAAACLYSGSSNIIIAVFLW